MLCGPKELGGLVDFQIADDDVAARRRRRSRHQIGKHTDQDRAVVFVIPVAGPIATAKPPAHDDHVGVHLGVQIDLQ